MTLNPWQKRRARNEWQDGYVEWVEGDTAYLSVVFSWHLPRAYQRASWHRAMGHKVRAGGPAVDIQPNYLDNAMCGGHVPSLHRHNRLACFTTRGCIRQCPFCAVPRIEGEFRELDNYELQPIVCDNNFLASSRKHFDAVIDGLKQFDKVDFNQGLDARLLTPYHAERLAELDYNWLRIAWDDIRYERQFMRGWQILRDAGIPRGKIGVYVLIGFHDTPEDALYRLETIWHKLKSWPYPMRYQPLDAMGKDEYIGKHWTAYELKRYQRYWSGLRYLSAVPFAEFDHTRRNHPTPKEQLAWTDVLTPLRQS